MMKNTDFNESVEKNSISQCTEKFKLLSDPCRLAVLRLLMVRERFVSEMQEILGIEQSLLSHHLKHLRNESLVVGTREGKRIRYRLSDEIKSKITEDTIDLNCVKISFADPQ